MGRYRQRYPVGGWRDLCRLSVGSLGDEIAAGTEVISNILSRIIFLAFGINVKVGKRVKTGL